MALYSGLPVCMIMQTVEGVLLTFCLDPLDFFFFFTISQTDTLHVIV